MKTRSGFVANSSSSSFVCEVCGEIESGWDISVEDLDMVMCLQDHYIHTNCLDETIRENLRLENDSEVEEDASLSKIHCPVCTLKVIQTADLLAYLLKQSNLTEEQLEQEIRQQFSSLEDFKAGLNERVKPIRGKI